MAACYFHPDRPGIGVCVRCRTVICAGCCTRLDGVNHCHTCLEKLGRRTAPPPPGRSLRGLVAVGVLCLAWAYFFAVFWWLQGVFGP